MLDRLPSGLGLLRVLLYVVPPGSDDRGPCQGCSERGQYAAVGAGGGVGDVTGGFAQGVGGLVLGAGLGTLSAGERS